MSNLENLGISQLIKEFSAFYHRSVKTVFENPDTVPVLTRNKALCNTSFT
jgi:hypothetical protein